MLTFRFWSMEGSKLELNELLNEIASLLNKIKDKIQQYYSDKDNDFMINQLNLIKSCLITFSAEMEENNSFHPNQLFELNKFFVNSLDSRNSYSKSLQIKEKSKNKLREIKEVLMSLKDPMGDFLDEFYKQDINFKISRNQSNIEENIVFLSDPLKLLNRRSTVIERDTFFFDYCKSHLSVSLLPKVMKRSLVGLGILIKCRHIIWFIFIIYL